MSEAVASNALSRKRIAAQRLPRITLDPTTAQNSTDLPANCCSQEDNNADVKKRFLNIGTAQSDNFTLSELSDSQSRSPVCYADRSSVQGPRTWPEVNNTFVCGYQLIGAGKEFTAYHAGKKVVKTCQIIDNEQYKKLLVIAHRLSEAEKYWKYEDVEAMRQFVLPSGTEVCVDTKGRRFMFSNWQYGTLHSKVQAGKLRLTESETFSLFSKIVRGVAFCHACGIVLRDVKLRKFVFIDRQMTQLRLRDIFDVFICENVKDDLLRDRHSCPAYVAPEILKDSAEYAGRPADIWALGVLLYVLLFGSYPFNEATPQRLFFRILKAKFSFPTQIPVSQAARALIFGMLRKEPSERPTAEQLLYVPLMEQNLDDSAVVSFRSLLPGFLEMSPSRVSSVLSTINISTLEFARQIMRLNSGNDDQVVPTISCTAHDVQRHLQTVRDIIAESSLTGTTVEEDIDESSPSGSNLATISTASDSVISTPGATSIMSETT